MSVYAKKSFNIIKSIRVSVRFTSIYSPQKLKIQQKNCTPCFNSPFFTKNKIVHHNLFFRHFHASLFLFNSVTVNCPAFAESISEGDVRWEKAVGDAVVEDDTVAEIETDKTSIPIPAPTSGIIEELLVEDGTTVIPGTALFKIKTDGTSSTPSKPIEKVEESEESKPTISSLEQKSDASPEQLTIPSSPPPVTPLPTKPLATINVENVKLASMNETAGTPSTGSNRSEHRVKMNRMRLRIAQRLKDSQNTAAMLTTFNEIDMSTIMAMRSKYKDTFLKKHGLKLSFMSAFIKASTYALQVFFFNCNFFG